MRSREQIIDEISNHEIAIEELMRELDEHDAHDAEHDPFYDGDMQDIIDDDNAQRNADVNMEIRGAYSC
ncbi:MAG: hypothetical protein ACYS7Y_32210 [Planctomycetota bacterium]